LRLNQPRPNESRYLFLMESSTIWRRLAGPAVIFLLPAVVLSVTPTFLVQASWLDPYVYSAYIHDYPQTLRLYGATYYSNRIAAIDFSRIVWSLLHSELSYYVVRYALFAMASASIFTIVRRFYGVIVATFAVVLLGFSPWYVRALASEYVDGFAITYLFVALAFLIVPRRHVVWGHVAAGMFLALTVNTNLWALAFAATFAPAWYLLHSRQGAPRLALLAFAAACGFVAMYAALGVSLHLEFPVRPLMFEGKTLEMAFDQLGSGRLVYFHPLSRILPDRYYLLVPLVLSATMLIAMSRLAPARFAFSRQFVVVSGIYLVAMVALYSLAHVLHHALISYIYYFSYALIASYLVCAALVGEAAAAANQKDALIILGVGAAAYCLAYVSYTVDFAKSSWPVWVWACTALLLPLCLLLRLRPVTRLVIIVIGVIAVPIPFYHSVETYSLLHSRTQNLEEWDVYRGARYFQATIGQTVDLRAAKIPRRAVRFWYGGSPKDRNLNSIQSMYLWGYSKLPDGLKIDDDFRMDLGPARYLVLLGIDASEIEQRMAALTRASIPFNVLRRDQFSGVVWSFKFTTLELTGDRKS